MPNSIDIDKFANLGGHIVDEQLCKEILAQQPYPLLATSNFKLRGDNIGKRIVLTDYIIQANKVFNVHLQTIGDCTSHACGLSIDILKGIDKVKNNQEYIADTATEISYSLGRVECANRRWSGSDGCTGSAISEGARKYGVLLRKQYGKYNFTVYDGDLARRLGESGCPDELEPEAKNHILKTISLTTNIEDAAEACLNGFPTVICSDVGFDCRRDRYGKILKDDKGFLYQAGSWNHAMVLSGVDWDRSRPACLIQNSWGDFCSGPKRYNEPEGSFWVDFKTVDKMLKQNDSFTYSNFLGYEPQKLSLRLL
jgi:hypothetical protein